MDALKQLEDAQEALAAAFDKPHSRHMAGSMVEGMVFRGITDRLDPIDAEAAFGVAPGEVIKSIEVRGNGGDFVLVDHEASAREHRPLYLEFYSTERTGVEGIFITESAVYIIQTTVDGGIHAGVMPTVLLVLDRLQACGIAVDNAALELVYCLLGVKESRIRELMAEARTRIEVLQNGDPQAELAALPEETRARLSRIRVEGVIWNVVYNTLALA
ncbi:hypothetical protein GGX14DRAFT_588408 [Mycena pura]|uniref:Uncharacterized protein n=1 Tax=Mycena pura TaxID=153505 RepID=A0AAD6US85_9AGAR|nr:hypothetical protein GGX14DRAFT_588408 [Mycena pura]